MVLNFTPLSIKIDLLQDTFQKYIIWHIDFQKKQISNSLYYIEEDNLVIDLKTTEVFCIEDIEQNTFNCIENREYRFIIFYI